jgi:hypothetical protein
LIHLHRKQRVWITGHVQVSGSGRPVAGAKVSVFGGQPVLTDTQGAFRLAFTAGEERALQILAAGFLPYAEALDLEQNSGAQVYGLVPESLEGQLQARLVARLAGEVRDVSGQPVPRAIVDVHSDPPQFVGGLAGRMILRGGFPEHQPRVFADEQGRFVLMTRLTGVLVLTTYSGGERIEQRVSAALGSDLQGLQLRGGK